MFKWATAFVLWRLWRRDRRRAAMFAAPTDEERAESDDAVAEALLSFLRSWQVILLNNNYILDQKAVGLLTGDVAAFTIVLAAHKSLGQFWLLPAAIMLLAAFFFYRVIMAREYDLGPGLDEFRTNNDGTPALDVKLAMAADLQVSVQSIADIVDEKLSQFRWGYRVLTLSLVVAALCVLLHTY
jgi:hypothetical protein